METLVLFILGPVVVLALLSLLSVLACRRFHHGRLQRLQEFDTEQGAIDGLITSNVGDSTLAVRVNPALYLSLFYFKKYNFRYKSVFLGDIYSAPFYSKIPVSTVFFGL